MSQRNIYKVLRFLYERKISVNPALSSVLVLTVLLSGCAMLDLISMGFVPAEPQLAEQAEDYIFSTTQSCMGCHVRIAEQYVDSLHAESFSDPIFQAQYFTELLPQTEKNPELLKEAEACTRCHAPIAYIKLKRHIIPTDRIDKSMSQVACDFCHSIAEFEGEHPGNGNYVPAPHQERKFGPFKYEKEWHHIYSELHTQSEFCAICHNATNRYGLEVKSTYTEWKNSFYAEEGITCQDCHMNRVGFLVKGEPRYERGRAARMALGKVHYRRKLYTHRFPGTHVRKQLMGAMTLDISFDRPRTLPGEEITISVSVNNSRTGHKMPSGCTEMRLLWLEIEANVNGRTIPVAASSDLKGESAHDVTGSGNFDNEFLGNDFPKGNRIYRAVLIDEGGIQTATSYDAKEIIFDNRLDATEVREETYSFKVPDNVRVAFVIDATLYYLPYPAPFAKRLELPAPRKTEIASARKVIAIRQEGDTYDTGGNERD
jgi:hypothetical protein